jgi:hypothetical protein
MLQINKEHERLVVKLVVIINTPPVYVSAPSETSAIKAMFSETRKRRSSTKGLDNLWGFLIVLESPSADTTAAANVDHRPWRTKLRLPVLQTLKALARSDWRGPSEFLRFPIPLQV